MDFSKSSLQQSPPCTFWIVEPSLPFVIT
jgi:hypothetical protein